MTTLIEVKDLSKEYRTRGRIVQALRNVSFSVEAGEAFGFVGPNGAGKSTTIKVLLNIISDYSGQVMLNGVSARESEARLGVGYVPESPALHEMLTPVDLLLNAINMHRLRLDDPRAFCLRWLEKFSVAHVATRRVRELSKGTVQRVALAHAMVVRPKILILDEPLSGLDPLGRKDVVDILAQYRRNGGTVFFTSHVLHDVERVADRFALIHKGEIRTVRSPAELVGGEELLTVRSVGQQPVPGMSPDTDGRWYAEVPGDDVWAVLEALRAAGHTLVEVRPALSLEAAFMRFVGESDLSASPREP